MINRGVAHSGEGLFAPATALGTASNLGMPVAAGLRSNPSALGIDPP
jgi:hypothetical protein